MIHVILLGKRIRPLGFPPNLSHFPSARLVTSRMLPDSKRPVTKMGAIPPAFWEKHGLREQLKLSIEEYEKLLEDYRTAPRHVRENKPPQLLPIDHESSPASADRLPPSSHKQLVMVFMDETYIDLAMGGGTLPVHKDPDHRGPAEQEGVRNMCTKTDMGERLIVIHAFTADGFLSHPDYRGVVEKDHDDLYGTNRTLHMENKIPTAECIWSNRVGYKDYHKALTGEDFKIWLHSRLEPAFRSRYGADAIMVLVLDSE